MGWESDKGGWGVGGGGLVWWGLFGERGGKLSREIPCILNRAITSWLKIFISSSKQACLPSLLFWCFTTFVHESKNMENVPSILWLAPHSSVWDSSCNPHRWTHIHMTNHIHTSTGTYLLWVRFSVVCTVPLRPRSPPGAWPPPLCRAAP